MTSLGSSAVAHQPHDEVRALALSPAFSQDGVAVAVVRFPPAPDPGVLMRTNDGGLSWKRMAKGLDFRGEFTSVCMSPNFVNDSTVFATEAAIGTPVAHSNGVYASTDQGLSWSKISSGLPTAITPAVSACLVDANANPILLVAGRYGTAARTDDFGATWTQLVDYQITVTAFGVSPDVQNDGIVVAGDDQGNLYVSTDYGSSWSLVAAVPASGAIREIALSAGGATAFVATDAAGLLRTTDGATTLVLVSADFPVEAVTALALSPNFDQDLTLFAATVGGGVFRSSDAGSSWTQHEEGIQLDDDALLMSDYHYQTICVSDDFAVDQTIFVTMFEGLYRSTDAGHSWFQMETLAPTHIMGLAVSPDYASDQTVALVRYGGGATVSTSGGNSWAPSNQGISNPFNYDVQFSPNYTMDQTLFSLSYGYRTIRSTDRGANWSLGGFLDGFQGTKIAISSDWASDATAFVGSRRDGIFRTTDGGASWALAYFDFIWARVDSLALSPDFATQPVVFAGRRGRGVLRSTDGGNSWETVNVGLPIDSLRGPTVRVSPTYLSDQRVLAATLQGLYESNDGGDSWSAMSINGVALDSPFEEVAFSPAFAVDNTILTTVRGRGLFKSVDGGATWSEIAPALIADNEMLQKIRFATRDIIFGYSDKRVFRSTDGGSSWQELQHGPIRVENSIPVDQWLLYDGSGQGFVWPSASAGRVSLLETRGSEVRFFFYGTGVSWIGVRANFLGIADVYLDGVLQGQVDQYGAALEPLAMMYQVTGLPQDIHELKIVVSGLSNPAASGVGAAIDAFDYLP